MNHKIALVQYVKCVEVAFLYWLKYLTVLQYAGCLIDAINWIIDHYLLKLKWPCAFFEIQLLLIYGKENIV